MGLRENSIIGIFVRITDDSTVSSETTALPTERRKAVILHRLCSELQVKFIRLHEGKVMKTTVTLRSPNYSHLTKGKKAVIIIHEYLHWIK